MSDAAETDVVCRICFDGADAGNLTEPCKCSGTHACVHSTCLLRWRRIQMLQGKSAAAARCEICGQKYAADLELPKKPLIAQLSEFGRVFVETVLGLVVCTVHSPLTLCSPTLLVALGCPCLMLGIGKGMLTIIFMFPAMTFFLYTKGIKLSVLGGPGQYHLGLTSFGAPVDGLQAGMLLVSIGARGPFEETVLYVIEHSDTSTLALILNKPAKKKQSRSDGGFNLSLRNGGPLQANHFCIHNIAGIPGSERLLQGRPVFLSRNLGSSLEAFKSTAQEDASIVIFQGFASWGSHQLEGEVRRGAWGWIKPEDIRPEDVLEMDHAVLDRTWERLVNAPHLQIFEG